jgi:hypothetical protein
MLQVRGSISAFQIAVSGGFAWQFHHDSPAAVNGASDLPLRP